MIKLENYIKDVLNSALLQGKLSNEQEIINILYTKYTNETVFSEQESYNMIKSLQSCQQQILERRKKLNNIEFVNTLGEYLQLWQEENEINNNKISSAIDISIKEIENIKKNMISPIQVGVQKMARLIDLFKLKFTEAKRLIEKTYILHNIEFSEHTLVSRFDEVKQAGQDKSIQSGMEELFVEAHQRKVTTENSTEKIQQYFINLEKEYNRIKKV